MPHLSAFLLLLRQVFCHYFFKMFNGACSFSTSLKKYIPEFVVAGTIREYRLAVLKLITEICDTHAHPNIMFSLWGNGYAPFSAMFVENKFVVNKDNYFLQVQAKVK